MPPSRSVHAEIASASASLSEPAQYRAVGIVLAIGSGVLIGSSFVFKKKGLLSSQKGGVAGEGVAYLKSPMWWTGMALMILGELCNFAAYAFVEAIIVTPMGALSVVISSILSHIVLHEKLSLFGWISSFQCLLGASILALNGPQEQSVSTIVGFKALFVTPWFLAYAGACIFASIVLAAVVAPRWGRKSMLPYLGVCSLIGGLSVSCTQGLGTSIVTSIRGDNQFKEWFIYFLLVFVVITLLTEVYYLNVALAMFNTAMVTPTYYVTFTFCTLVTSIILYQGLKASATQIMTIVLAFVVICTGIVILQMSKVDPTTLTHVDERTTLLLQAACQDVKPHPPSRPGPTIHVRAASRSSEDARLDHAELHEIVARTEEPGLDALRGTFGALGTVIRARRRASEFARRGSRLAAGSPVEDAGGTVRSARNGERRSRDGMPVTIGLVGAGSACEGLPGLRGLAGLSGLTEAGRKLDELLNEDEGNGDKEKEKESGEKAEVVVDVVSSPSPPPSPSGPGNIMRQSFFTLPRERRRPSDGGVGGEKTSKTPSAPPEVRPETIGRYTR